MPFILGFLAIFFSICSVKAQDFEHRDSGRFSSSDFFYKENNRFQDRTFEDYEIISADVDLGVSSGGCGQIDVHKSLRANLNGLLNEKYFQSMGKDIASSSFMLATCYFSPQICSILKSSRINASMLGSLNFSHCAATNKYINSRVEDWELAKQKCYNKALNDNGGNADAAMNACGRNSFAYDLDDWSGETPETKTNRLLEASARWLGLRGKEAKRMVNVTKAFIGDSVISRGRIEVDFGDLQKPTTASAYYQKERQELEKKLSNIVNEIESGDENLPAIAKIEEEDLEEINSRNESKLVDRETLASLAKLPRVKRRAATQKLASSIAIHRLASDANKSIDFLTVAEQNPKLPENRKKEIRNKRRALKENVESAIFFAKQKNEPVNAVLQKIKEDGQAHQAYSINQNLESNVNNSNQDELKSEFFNCSDGFMCLR